ncbi:MAG: hypothetical protein QXX91_03335 [Thermoplasmata archaeon]
MENLNNVILFEPFLVGSRNGRLVKEIADSMRKIDEYTELVINSALDPPVSLSQDLSKQHCRFCNKESEILYYFLDEYDKRKLHGGYCSPECYTGHQNFTNIEVKTTNLKTSGL